MWNWLSRCLVASSPASQPALRKGAAIPTDVFQSSRDSILAETQGLETWSTAEGAALRGAEMPVREERECSVWCRHILPGQPSQMFITFGFTMLPKKAKQTCSSVGNLRRNLLSARFSLPALPAGASWVFAFFHPVIVFHQSKHSQGMQSLKAY